MRLSRPSASAFPLLVIWGLLPSLVNCLDILKTSGFSQCGSSSDIKVEKINVQYDRNERTVIFDVSGSSAKSQNVTASLTVTAFGREVYHKDFNPCDDATKVVQLCPVPAGNFSAKGSQVIPAEYANLIPDIAFQLPDLDGQAKLQLKAAGGNQDLACIESTVNNGKTIQVPAVSYVAAGVTGAALIMSGVSAIGGVAGAGAANAAGVASPSPSFGEVLGWLQTIAMSGMLSVDYPPAYRSFTRNFAFSGGLVSWDWMLTRIDNFRNVTGGDLSSDSVAYLRNANLVYRSSPSSGNQNITRRGLYRRLFDGVVLEARDISTSVNGSESTTTGLAGSNNSTNPEGPTKVTHAVHGIQAFAERLMVPKSDIFMTCLLVFAVIVGAIAVGILLFKLILEAWALCASFPKSLTGFRKRYWGLLGRTIVNLILIVYGVWTLYCIFQFVRGDSWAAKVLAGVTLTIFTAILGFFTFRIWQLARKYKKAEGDTSALFENKETWRKYSLFYDQYKKDLWWIFIPAILYMFAKGTIIAAGDGHGLVQTIGQLTIEVLMLALLLWSRPYARKSANWINVVIQVVRVLSVVCILVFVEELGVAQTTKTVTGVVLIAMQSALTGALAILIAVNAIIICCKENPHRKRRKEAEKLSRDLDNLTPLDARNSLLMEPPRLRKDTLTLSATTTNITSEHPSYNSYPIYRDDIPTPYDPGREDGRGRRDSRERLIPSAATMPYSNHPIDRSISADSRGLERQPTVPNVGL
ncbi:MAG: hypothetical protein M1816_001732 [Peltula sp. TS41687]|nr:MAG: hypothetical protein M1816_001732 [Peltula sp. TS41687]